MLSMFPNDLCVVPVMDRFQTLDYRTQFNVTDVAERAGIVTPTYVSRAVYNRFFAPGRTNWEGNAAYILEKLMETLSAVIFKHSKMNPKLLTMPFRFYVKSTDGQTHAFTLLALLKPVDDEDFQRSICLYMPGEL